MKASAAERRALLRRVPLFGELSDGELDALPTSSRALDDGETLFDKGQSGAAAYVVAAGCIKVTTSAGRRELLLDLVPPGGLIGEMALFDGEPRSAAAGALGATRLVAIDRRDLLELFRRRPEAALRMLAYLAARVRRTTAALEESVGLDIAARLGRRLVALGGAFGRAAADGLHIELPLDQQQLADLIGATRESVNKQLRAWSRAGLLSVARGRITLKGPTALTVE